MTDATSPWRETGDTDLSSFTKAISRSTQPGSSPMASSAAGVYEVLRRYGLTRLGAAMAWHERKNDSWVAAYGLDSSFRNPWAMRCNAQATACRKNWSVYASYEEAANAWARRLLDPRGPYASTQTLGDLIGVYAPSFENDVVAYVSTISREIDALPLAGGPVVANPFRAPVIYELYRDYARFGLTNAQAVKIGNHRFTDRNGQRPQIVVLHIQEGTTVSSLNWWASGNADASSTVMVQKDGTLLRVLSDRHGPWTNGDVQRPSPKGQALLTRIGGANPNLVTLSIETEGWSGEKLTDAQLLTICWQVQEWLNAYNLTVDDVYRHADFNSVSRANCPGAYFDTVLAALRAGAGTTPAPEPTWSGKPLWLDDRLVVDLFPEASPGGTRTKAWLAYAAASGRAPRRIKFHFVGTPQETIEFSDGLLIFRDGTTSVGKAVLA